MTDVQTERGGLSRRSFVKRTAAVTGATAWVVPAVDSFMSPAGAARAGSPACSDFTCSVVTFPNGAQVVFRCTVTNPDEQNCLCCCGGVTSACEDCALPDPCTVQMTCTPDPTCTV